MFHYKRMAILAVGILAITRWLGGEALAASGKRPRYEVWRRAVVRLEVEKPGGERARGVGFYAEVSDVGGLVAPYHLVAGASKVRATAAGGRSFTVEEFTAAVPEQDLILLSAPDSKSRLRVGSYRTCAKGQEVFVPQPPDAKYPAYTILFVGPFILHGTQEMLGLWKRVEPGCPVVDSLGTVVGMAELYPSETLPIPFAVPNSAIEQLFGIVSPPKLLGSLDPAAAPDWLDPNSLTGKVVRGAILFRVGRVDQGRQLISEVVTQTDSTDVAALLELGMSYQLQDQLDKAEALYRKALEFSPRHGRGLLYLGSCLLNQQLYEDALSVYQEAASAMPENPEPHLGIGGVLYSQGDVEGAAEEFRKATQLDSRSGLARANLIVAYRDLGEVSKARAEEARLRALRSGYKVGRM